MHLSRSKMTPKNKMSVKKKYVTTNFTPVVHKPCQIISTFTNQCHCLYLHSQCLHHPHTSNIPNLFTALSQHIIITPFHCIGYTTLLKTLRSHFCEVALPSHYDLHWWNTMFIFLGLLTCLNPWRFTVLSTCSVSGVKNFCVMSVFWSVWVQSCFHGFNLWISPGFIFDSCS